MHGPSLYALALLLGLATGGFGCPTGLNIIPSADVIGAGVYSLQLELDGHATPFSGGAELWGMVQLGLTDRLEIGVDAGDMTDGAHWCTDAKWQVLPEAGGIPAVAVGLLGLTRFDAEGAWYVVASGSPQRGPLRLTAGLLRDDATRGLLGLQWDADDLHSVYADWTTGPDAYASVGLWRSLSDTLGVQLYYARDNSSRQDDFVGLNVYLCGSWGGQE